MSAGGYAHDDGATAMLTTDFDPSGLHAAKTKVGFLTRRLMILFSRNVQLCVAFGELAGGSRRKFLHLTSGGPFSGGRSATGRAHRPPHGSTPPEITATPSEGENGPETPCTCVHLNLGAGATLFQLQVSGTKHLPSRSSLIRVRSYLLSIVLE